MAINLSKGNRINLEKGLTQVAVGLGWKANQSSGADYDLDASAFMIGSNKKIPQDEFFVFYNNQKSPDGAVQSSGDNLVGGSDQGDDETLTVDLSKVDPRVQEIIFTVTIHEFEKRKQNFGQVRNSYIRIYNSVNNEEIAKYELEEDFSLETAVEFGRLYLLNGQWKFEALGLGFAGGLQYFVDKYAQ